MPDLTDFARRYNRNQLHEPSRSQTDAQTDGHIRRHVLTSARMPTTRLLRRHLSDSLDGRIIESMRTIRRNTNKSLPSLGEVVRGRVPQDPLPWLDVFASTSHGISIRGRSLVTGEIRAILVQLLSLWPCQILRTECTDDHQRACILLSDRDQSASYSDARCCLQTGDDRTKTPTFHLLNLYALCHLITIGRRHLPDAAQRTAEPWLVCGPKLLSNISDLTARMCNRRQSKSTECTRE
jgi:hypothetical protein